MPIFLADLEASRARDRQVGRAGRELEPWPRRHRNEQRRHRRSRRPDACDRAGLAADVDLLAGFKAGGAPDIDCGRARACGGCQSRAGEAEQVEAVSRDLRPGRNRRQLDGSPLAPGVDQAPVGNVDLVVGSVVKLDELVGRVVAVAEADLVDFDRQDIPHPLGSCLEFAFRRPSGFSTRPCRSGSRHRVVAGEVTLNVAVTLAPGAIGSAKVFEMSGGAGDHGRPSRRRGNAQLDARHGHPGGIA